MDFLRSIPLDPPGPPAPPPAPPAPLTAQSRADRAALAAVWTAPILGWILKMSVPGWFMLAMFIYSPVIIGVLAWGLVPFVRAFAKRSRVRAQFGRVPRRYHLAAWSWAVAAFAPFVVLVDGGIASGDDAVLTKVLGWTPSWYGAFQDGALVTCLAALLLINVLLTVWTVSSDRARPSR